jgi:hypothetical protein
VRGRRGTQVLLAMIAFGTALAMAVAAGARSPAAGPAPGATLPAASGGGFGPLALASTAASPVVASDTPPPLRQAEGWPFAELPLVIKSEPVPAPRVSVPFNAPAPVDDVFSQAVTGTLPRTAEAPVRVTGLSPWFLLPPIAGIGIYALDGDGSDGGGGGEEPPPEPPPPPPPPGPPEVVPEPSSWALLASGLLLVGLAARRRRRGDQAPLE